MPLLSKVVGDEIRLEIDGVESILMRKCATSKEARNLAVDHERALQSFELGYVSKVKGLGFEIDAPFRGPHEIWFDPNGDANSNESRANLIANYLKAAK